MFSSQLFMEAPAGRRLNTFSCHKASKAVELRQPKARPAQDILSEVSQRQDPCVLCGSAQLCRSRQLPKLFHHYRRCTAHSRLLSDKIIRNRWLENFLTVGRRKANSNYCLGQCMSRRRRGATEDPASFSNPASDLFVFRLYI